MKKYLLLCAAFFGTSALAGPPVKTPKCSDPVQIRPARGGAGVFFDQNCSTAYVLPPAVGSMELTGISASASKEDCRELAALEKTRAELAERLERLTKPKAAAQPLPGSTIGGGGGLSSPGPVTSPQEGDNGGDISQALEKTIKDIEKLRSATKYFSEIEGLVAGISYTSDHDGMVAEYAKLNPAVKNFTRLQPETAYLTMISKRDKLLQERSEILDYDVPGIVRFPSEGETSSGEDPKNSVYFGSGLTGQLRLTAKAACSLMNASGRVPERMNASQLSQYFVVNITYSYALNVYRKYTAKYDFKKLFEHIQKQTQKGGFLSSKSVNEIIQRNESSSWFTFQGESDDTRYSNEVLVQQLKTEMIDRVMGQIAIGTVPGSASLPAPLEPGRKGADVAAEGLKKCPYTYCQVAGYVLDFVSATFGSSQSVARFLSTVGSDSSETVDESRALRFIGTTQFRDRL